MMPFTYFDTTTHPSPSQCLFLYGVLVSLVSFSVRMSLGLSPDSFGFNVPPPPCCPFSPSPCGLEYFISLISWMRVNPLSSPHTLPVQEPQAIVTSLHTHTHSEVPGAFLILYTVYISFTHLNSPRSVPQFTHISQYLKRSLCSTDLLFVWKSLSTPSHIVHRMSTVLKWHCLHSHFPFLTFSQSHHKCWSSFFLWAYVYLCCLSGLHSCIHLLVCLWKSVIRSRWSARHLTLMREPQLGFWDGAISTG